MKLTKFQHACLVLEKEKSTLIIDPGTFTHDFIMPKHVDAIIVTHNHPDHCDPSLIEKIHRSFPKASLIAHESVTSQYSFMPTITVDANESLTVGPYHLAFIGGTHAPIAPSIQVPPNLGILIDECIYYPGDSFVTPPADKKIAALALPVSAPWLTIDKVFTLLHTLRPTLAFPTHDAILSPDGQGLIDRMVGQVASEHGTTYKRLNSESIELS